MVDETSQPLKFLQIVAVGPREMRGALRLRYGCLGLGGLEGCPLVSRPGRGQALRGGEAPWMRADLLYSYAEVLLPWSF